MVRPTMGTESWSRLVAAAVAFLGAFHFLVDLTDFAEYTEVAMRIDYPKTRAGWVFAGILIFVWGWVSGFITDAMYLDTARWGAAVGAWLRETGCSARLASDIEWFLMFHLLGMLLLFLCGLLLPVFLGNYWFRFSAILLAGYWIHENYAIKSLVQCLGRAEFAMAAHYVFVVGLSCASAFGGACLGARWFPPKHADRMTCPNCGYCLFGLSEPRCPECGREFDPQ